MDGVDLNVGLLVCVDIGAVERIKLIWRNRRETHVTELVLRG